MFDQNDIDTLLDVLMRGRQNAQIAFDIARQIGYPTGGNQVKTRKLIKYAIQNGRLIKSSTKNPSGFWLSDDRREINNNIISLRRRAKKIIESANNLQSEWNRQHPDERL